MNKQLGFSYVMVQILPSGEGNQQVCAYLNCCMYYIIIVTVVMHLCFLIIVCIDFRCLLDYWETAAV